MLSNSQVCYEIIAHFSLHLLLCSLLSLQTKTTINMAQQSFHKSSQNAIGRFHVIFEQKMANASMQIKSQRKKTPEHCKGTSASFILAVNTLPPTDSM